MAKAPEKRDPWVPLRQSYPQSERISAVSPLAECLFLRLLALVDDQSAFFADAQRLRCLAFPLRAVSVTKTARVRDEIVAKGLVRLYGDGQYLVIVNPKQFHRADVKPDLRFPPPPQEDNEHVTNPGRTRNESGPSYVKEYVKEEREKQRAREDELPAEIGGAALPPAAPKTTDDDPGAIMAFKLEFFKAAPATDPARGSNLPGWSTRGADSHRGWAKWVFEQPPGLLRSITAADLSQAKHWGDEKKWGWGPGTLIKYLEQKKPAASAAKEEAVAPWVYWSYLSAEERQEWFDRAAPELQGEPNRVIWGRAQELWQQDRLRAGKEKEQC